MPRNMPLRLSLLPADIFYDILILLSLHTIGTLIGLLSGTSRLVALHVFKGKILHELLFGTSQVLIAAPTLNFPIRAHPAVQLVIATRSQTDGPIIIHYTPTQATGAANEALFLELVSEFVLEIQQPMPQDPPGDDITFRTEENKLIRPKKSMKWEIISSQANKHIYKFTLENEIPNHPIRDYFAKHLEIYIKVAIIDRGLRKVEDIFFNFHDLFFIYTFPLIIIYINV
jgi:hypothetical protein